MTFLILWFGLSVYLVAAVVAWQMIGVPTRHGRAPVHRFLASLTLVLVALSWPIMLVAVMVADVWNRIVGSGGGPGGPPIDFRGAEVVDLASSAHKR